MTSPGDWIEWDGTGSLPDFETLRSLKLRDGTETDDLMRGWWSRFEWERPNDIIAYRVTEKSS